MPIFDRPIRLGLRFSDTPDITIDEFNSITQGLDIVNNISVPIFNNQRNIPENINDLSATRSQRRIGRDKLAKIAAINKNSPLTIEMEFGSIGAFLVLVNLSTRVESWSWNYSRQEVLEELQKLEFQYHEEYVAALERAGSVYNELAAGRSSDILTILATSFNNNSVKLEGVKILEVHLA